MAFPSPPSFESDVHPEQLLFLEFHAENRTLGGRENPNKMVAKMGGWMGSEKHRKEPAVEKEEDRLSDGLFRVWARADAAEIRAFLPFSAPTTAILLCLWSSWAGCALSFAVAHLLFPLLALCFTPVEENENNANVGQQTYWDVWRLLLFSMTSVLDWLRCQHGQLMQMPCGWSWVIGTCCHFFPSQITFPFPLQMTKYEVIHDVIYIYIHMTSWMREREREFFFWFSCGGKRLWSGNSTDRHVTQGSSTTCCCFLRIFFSAKLFKESSWNQFYSLLWIW